MSTLFGEDIDVKQSAGREPSEDELGEAVMEATLMAVNKKFIGQPPASMTKKDIARELLEPTLRRARKWRAGGKVKLFNFCYVSACHALTDYMRKLHLPENNEKTTVEALEQAAAEYVIYGDEYRKYLLFKAVFGHIKARAGRDVFENGVVNMSELDRIF